MKIKFTPLQLQHISRIGLFLCVVAIIVALFPKENKFKYQFEVGKPWTYELITAAFDFPIYKSDQQVAKEREEVLKDYTPFFKLDTTVNAIQVNKMFTDWQKNHGSQPDFQAIIKNKFKEIYSVGIISIEDYNKLLESKRNYISCISPDRVTHTVSINEVYTPKSAYEEIIRNAPEALKSYDLNLYLIENLKYDSTTSVLSRVDILKNVSLTSGMVQTGERIIDRGEIVNPITYQVLHSLKIESEKRSATIQKSSIVVVGEVIMILGLMILLFLYIYLFRPRIYDSLSNLIFVLLLILMMVSLVSLTLRINALSYYMVPFALIPIIIRVFFDSRTALFVHIISMLMISFMVDNSFQFILLQITIGMAAVSSLKDMSQRSQLAQTALYIFLSYVLIIAFFLCLTN